MKDLIKTIPMDPELKAIQSVGRLNRPVDEVEIKVIGPELDIYGREDDFKEILESEFAGDETYALPGDCLMQNLDASCAPRLVMMGGKGVVAQVIPDDQIPTDTDGNKADLLLPEDRASDIVTLPYLAADHDGNTVRPRPRQLIRSKNHQRHGYSKRKAKRHAAVNSVFKARFKARSISITGWLDSCSELTFDASITETNSYMQMQKPTPDGRGDLNG